MRSLTIATAQAINTVRITDALAAYLSEHLQLPVAFADGVASEACYQMLDDGKIHLCWICGLPYVNRADRPGTPIELLAAPVMKGERYGGRPIYYSDVVVRRDSPFKSFADLRGASWAFNDAGSHSGYCVVRHHLSTLGHESEFFGQLVASGAHRNSLELVLAGKVDASAIDTTVLEWEYHHRPEIKRTLRTVEILGPSPIPPLVILNEVADGYRKQIRSLLLELHMNQRGRNLLALGLLERFVSVNDADYDPIRVMAARAAAVTL